MNPNVIPIIWVGFIGAVPLLLFVGTQNPAVLGAIVSFVVLAVVVAIYWRRPSSRAVAATTTRHELRSLNARGRRLLWAFAPACPGRGRRREVPLRGRAVGA